MREIIRSFSFDCDALHAASSQDVSAVGVDLFVQEMGKSELNHAPSPSDANTAVDGGVWIGRKEHE